MKTTESNKLITEFRGFDITPFKNDSGEEGFTVFPKGSGINGCSRFGDVNKAKDYVISRLNNYHKSWDDIMPVVDQIEDMGYCVTIKGTYAAGGGWCRIDGIGKADFSCDYILRDSKRQAVYEAVIEFIKWHNSKQQREK